MARGSFIQGFAVLTTEEEAFQAPVQIVKALIQKAELVNTGAAPVTIDVWITPDSATSTSDNLKVVSSKQIGVNETFVAIELIGEYINTGGKVFVQGSALGVSMWLNGNQFKTEV